MEDLKNDFHFKSSMHSIWKKGSIHELEDGLTFSEKPLSKKEKDSLPAFGFGKTVGDTSNQQLYPTNFLVGELDTPEVLKNRIKAGNKELEKEQIDFFKELFSKLKKDTSLKFHTIYLSSSMRGMRFILETKKPVQDKEEYELTVKSFLRQLEKYGIDESYHDLRTNQFWYFPTFKNYFFQKKEIFQNFEIVEKTEKKNKKNSKKAEKTVSTQTKELKRLRKIIDRIFSFLQKNKKSITASHEEWIKVGFALINTFPEEDAKNYFLKFSALDSEKFDRHECLQKFQDLRTGKPSIRKCNFGTIIFLAKEKGYKLKPKTYKEISTQFQPKIFWQEITFPKRDPEVKINQLAFCRFLGEEGFYYLKKSLGSSYAYIDKNVISEVSVFDIKQFLKERIYQFDDELFDKITKDDLLNKLINGGNVFLGSSTLEFLTPAPFKQCRDSISESFIPFENGVVKVTTEKIELISYLEIDGQFWKEQIIPHRVELIEKEKIESQFEDFVYKISGGTVESSEKLKKVIGYLLSTHKDPTNTKAIILMDEKSNGAANGGSGKTLLAEAIGKLRTSHQEDGKNFDSKNKFKYQQIKKTTQVLLIDDVPRDFEFEKLFSAITNGFTVEKKNKDAYNINYLDSPKILITSNYLVRNDNGDSFWRRALIVEISRYFKKELTPMEEYGKRFFQDWNESEWNHFYNFMIKCVHGYLF